MARPSLLEAAIQQRPGSATCDVQYGIEHMERRIKSVTATRTASIPCTLCLSMKNMRAHEVERASLRTSIMRSPLHE